MSLQKVFIGFIPWAAFSVVATRAGVGAVGLAALLACVVAAGLLARSVSRGESAKLIEVTGVVVFAALVVASLVDPGANGFLAVYGRGLAAAILAVVIFVTLPVLPFTTQYARESVPREYWHTPRFRTINRRISAAWGGIIAAMALGHLAGAVLGAGRTETGVGLLHRPLDLVFNWIIPALLIWTGVRYTARVSGAAESGDQHAVDHDDDQDRAVGARLPRGGRVR
jgi:hypothetical protein